MNKKKIIAEHTIMGIVLTEPTSWNLCRTTCKMDWGVVHMLAAA